MSLNFFEINDKDRLDKERLLSVESGKFVGFSFDDVNHSGENAQLQAFLSDKL